ncbi:MAG: alanine--tRNA ligase [Proteobacteria bacterium]|nr:alanine--tRNA ligase [Pseudomonadota bacterium]
MTSVNDIRKGFLSYFQAKGHELVASSSLVPAGDPTLMFTNAGMVQFKNLFTGLEKRRYRTAASSQKCVRAGGKHNDLDNVGYTARHHTFFEMLGNFSFGDYFKEQAIFYAWELLTKEFGLAPEKLTATVYHQDDEAYALWKKISGLPERRIIRINTHDNFWAMGETGPCGPCSEIFYDHGEGLEGGPPGSKNQEGDRFVEIWNLVFMQYEQVDKETRNDLPKPSIDTGMGLERIAAVLQGTHDNYQIDIFRALIEASVAETGVAATGKARASHRVIADHLRATSFLIADGVLPANEGRGYVLRRIMRRAMRHASILGAQDLLLYKLAPVLITEMAPAYPELSRARALITETLKLEEGRFRSMLERGLKLLAKERKGLGLAKTFPGEAAFKLYDTFGFPLDLTQDALKPEGIEVDVKAFNAAMDKQKAQARAAWKGSGEKETEEIWFDLHEQVGASEFLGYESEQAEARVVALVVAGKRVKKAKVGAETVVIVNQSPFYGESGGQVGDTGLMTSGKIKIKITDTGKKFGGVLAHYGKIEGGDLAVGAVVHLSVDHGRRLKIRANHSATHLLHKALRKTLGDHVTQKGSLVDGHHLRFDISHPKQITKDEIKEIAADVNAMIRQNGAVATHLMTPEDAIKKGAMALFGEKYGEEVRVVSMGLEDGDDYSVELCGGTHVTRTGDIALFKITGESAIAAGVRRLEGLTGEAARQVMLGYEANLRETAGILKSSPGEVTGRVASLVKERNHLAHGLADARKKIALGGSAKAAPKIKKIGRVSFIAEVLSDIPAGDLRSIADQAKQQIGSGVVALVTVNDGKASLLVAVTEDLTEKLNAVDLVRLGAEVLGGKGGGGRPDMAQAGGPVGGKADDALKAIEKQLKSLLN